MLHLNLKFANEEMEKYPDREEVIKVMDTVICSTDPKTRGDKMFERSSYKISESKREENTNERVDPATVRQAGLDGRVPRARATRV